MQMNIKVRLKNPVFWVGFIPSCATFVYFVLSLFGIFPRISEDTLVNALLAIVSALANLGVLVDPTTKGISDSDRAMTYDEPSGGVG